MSRSKKRNNRKKQNNQKNTVKNVTPVSTMPKQENPKQPVPEPAEKEVTAICATEPVAKPEETVQEASDREKPITADEGSRPEPEEESVSSVSSVFSEPAETKKISGAVTWLLNVLQIAVKGALLTGLFIGIWTFLTPYFRVDRNKEGDYMRNLSENSLDVLALGSSHMQYAFNPAVFSAETGYYSYVFGSVCQPFSESYYLLKEVLKTQHPEVVIIDVFTLLPQSQVCYADGTYYIAMDMMEGDNRIEAAEGIPDTVDEDTALGYKLDLYMNHGNWKTMDLSDTDAIVKNGRPAEGFSWELGYVSQDPEVFQYTPLEVIEPETVTALTDNEKLWIDRLNDLCREENIHLIFIKTPYIEDQDDANKLAGIWEYLDHQGIEYIDYLRKAEELDWFLDMDGDTWHNNTWGAEIITKDLANIIKEKGYITKHHDSSEIEGIYHLAEERTARYLMNEANINIYRLMEYGRKYPCTILFRYQGKNRSSIGAYENEALQSLGLNHDFINDQNKNYYAVIKNGELVEESSEVFETTLSGRHIEITSGEILIDGEPVNSNGEMQIVFCDNDFQWVNPIGINYASQYFWKAGCTGWACEATGS